MSSSWYATGSAKASAASPDSTTTQPTPAAANWSRSAPLNNICWTARARSTLAGDRSTADRQVAGRQHVGPDPPRQRVEYRCIARPLEAPHAVHGKDGDRAWVGVDHRRGRRPSRRIFHRGHLAAHSPRQIGKRGDQRRAADQRRRRPPEVVAAVRRRRPRLRACSREPPAPPTSGHRAARRGRAARESSPPAPPDRDPSPSPRAPPPRPQQDTAAARPPDGESPRAAREPRWRAVPPSQRPRKALSASSVRRQRSRSHRDPPGCPSVPRPGSARAANASTPSACEDANDLATTAADSHGSAATNAAPMATAAHRHRGHPAPGASTHATAMVAANISPVGVKPASAIQNTNVAAPSPTGFGLAQPQHRRGHPRQAAVAHEQAPVPLQQALGDVRIPDRDRHRHALPGQPGLGQNRSSPGAPRPTPRATARPSTAP